MNYKKGNNEMYYYSENNWTIRGLHDATHGELVIEIKTRMKPQNVRKNEYDLYQLFGYLLAMGKTKGKIVQKYNDIIYDSENETDTEYGIIDINEDNWRKKFNTFIKELNEFFDKMYNTSVFPYEKVFQNRKNLIEIKENNMPTVENTILFIGISNLNIGKIIVLNQLLKSNLNSIIGIDNKYYKNIEEFNKHILKYSDYITTILNNNVKFCFLTFLISSTCFFIFKLR